MASAREICKWQHDMERKMKCKSGNEILPKVKIYIENFNHSLKGTAMSYKIQPFLKESVPMKYGI